MRKRKLWVICALFPYLFGMVHLAYHSEKMENSLKDPIQVTLVQPSFPVEESLYFTNQYDFIDYSLRKWNHLLYLLSNKVKKGTDLIVLPEFIVPFTIHSFVYTYDEAAHMIGSLLGKEGLLAMPPKISPWAQFHGSLWYVNNAFFAETIANYHQVGLVLGLEDTIMREDRRHFFSTAFFFLPGNLEPQRYDKRILVPMGEYIPFDFLQDFAKDYKVFSSFTPGDRAVVFTGCRIPFSPSICYEETFGHMTRENRHIAAELLVNLTSDAWWPNSRLPKQHLDHAILRTTELGIPLVRACNTGITCAIDSLGRIVAELGEGSDNQEAISDILNASVSAYTYETLYSFWGDGLIVVLSLFTIALEVFWAKRFHRLPEGLSIDAAESV